ncbi:MAG: hypothetical protein L6R38_005316 [Xanthoria sp. 2 TBL-2021]|nr:MAG: hypothetical protein L6R38_005316 [Xanthoria sp. 2 TBL-2021]
MASFKGKVIAITGGASGIGQATAQLLATRGATVSIADVQQEALTTTADSIKKATPDAKVLTKIVDVTSSQQVDAWIQETVSQFGKIDGAANLAGITGKSANSTLVGDVEEDDFDKIIAVNVKGLFNCLKSQLNSMKEQGSGTIVNATSIAGLRGCPRSIGYCASKHAVVGMTKTAAAEYSENNIRVNAIAPGPIDTPMMHNLYGLTGKSDLSKTLMQAVPMHRYGTAEEVAKLILFLLGEDSSFCTGSVFGIDGGLTAGL